MTANTTVSENFFVGTNSNARHADEAIHRQIVAADEVLLGLFDGIFFDEDGKRVGGIALNDFLVITNRRITLWARDQFKDFVDAFPITHVSPGESTTKDALHGTLKLRLVLPDVPEKQLAKAESFEITFDFVPLADISVLTGMLEVLTGLNREMCAAKASAEERANTTFLVFEQTFVKGALAEAKATVPSKTTAPVYAEEAEPDYVIQEWDEEELMTPLSRLDALEGYIQTKRPANYASQPRTSPYSLDRDNLNKVASYKMAYQDDSKFLQPGEEYVPTPPPIAQPNFGSQTTPHTRRRGMPQSQAQSQYKHGTDQIEEELQWIKGGEATAPARPTGMPPVPKLILNRPPTARSREDLGNEGVYTVSRVGRAAWDMVGKLRREVETKGVAAIPGLNALRESGMTVREMTDFLVAVNGLMETVNRNPTAREIAMTFLNRAFPAGVKLGGTEKASKEPTKIDDDLAEELPIVKSAESKTKLKVERRSSNSVGKEAEETLNTSPIRQKVSIRKQVVPIENVAIEDIKIEDSASLLDDLMAVTPVTKSPRRIMVRETGDEIAPNLSATIKQVAVSSLGAGAADGGDDVEWFDPFMAELNFPPTHPEIVELDD